MNKRAFGFNKKGEAATLYTFENQNGMVMEVTDFGATLDKEAFRSDVIVKKGKKVFHRFTCQA